jgi:hypothetical protein
MDGFDSQFFQITVCKEKLLQMRRISLLLCAVFAFFFSEKLFAQHEHDMGKMQMKRDTVQKKTVQKKKKTAVIRKTPVKNMNVNKEQDIVDTAKAEMKMDMGDMEMNKTKGTNDTIQNMNSMTDTIRPMNMNMNNIKSKDTAGPGMNMKGNQNMQMDEMSDSMKYGMNMNMSHSFSRNLPMSRNGSGTSWMPDASPIYAYMIMRQKTMIMIHGNIFIRYTNHDVFNKGSRGGSGMNAPNWFMGMLQKPVGKKGLMMARAMISLDPLTVGGHGYPLLFQSGETYKGVPLVDHQHPHDLFSELGIGYTQEVNTNSDVFGYIGYPGEPALGPPAFMHRISAASNPDAPLGHHWQDATHITFGVATLGFRYKNFKIEGSAFNGHEPNEDRYTPDNITINSYSYRVSVNPSSQWALQFSQGFIKSPELSEPGVNVVRTTASVLFSKKISDNEQYDAAFIWGYNDKSDGHKEHSVLLENNHRIKKNTLYSRYEFIQKSAEELNIEPAFGNSEFNIHVATAGYNHLVFSARYFDLLGGFQGTINFVPGQLQKLYGKTPLAVEVYLQLRPHIHSHQ